MRLKLPDFLSGIRRKPVAGGLPSNPEAAR